jgi:hypothetical protein
LAVDNAGAGGQGSVYQVEDDVGNAWVVETGGVKTAGGPNDGVALYVATTHQDAGRIVTGTTITASFGAISTTQKAWAFWEITASPQHHATYRKSLEAVEVGIANDPSVAYDAYQIITGEAVIGVIAVEGAEAFDPDADESRGPWSAMQLVAPAGGLTVATQSKVVNGGGAQSYDLSASTYVDYVAIILSAREYLDPPPNVRAFIVGV